MKFKNLTCVVFLLSALFLLYGCGGGSGGNSGDDGGNTGIFSGTPDYPPPVGSEATTFALESKLLYEYNLPVFTAFALLNATGFDFDYKEVYHPLRQALRDDLSALSLNLIDNQFYSNQTTAWYTNYGEGEEESHALMAYKAYVFALTLKNEHPFTYQDGWSSSESILGISLPIEQSLNPPLTDFFSYMDEFYSKANISELYEKYRLDYQAIIEEFQMNTNTMIAGAVDYFGWDINTISSMRIIPNPLTAFSDGQFLDKWPSVAETGWRPELPPSLVFQPLDPVQQPGTPAWAGYSLVVHEFTHRFTSPIIKNAVNAALINEVLNIIQNEYPLWILGDDMIEESFVRAIDVWTVGGSSAKIDYETNDRDWVMTRFVYDRIQDFPTSGADFEGWMIQVMGEYVELNK